MIEELSELIDELRDHLGVDEDELEDYDASVLLNRSYWELLSAHPFREKERWLEFELQAGVRIYNAPNPMEALRGIYVIDSSNGKRVALRRSSYKIYEESYNAQDDAQGKPCIYMRHEHKIFVSPTPDVAYKATMYYWTTLTELLEGDDLVDAPREWREIVLNGAIQRGWTKKGAYNRMEIMRKMNSDMISKIVPVEAKEEIDSSMAGVECPGRSGR